MLAALLPFAFTTPQAIAQEGPLGWEGEIEVGVESVLSSDAPGNELSDAFLNVEISGSYAFSDRVFVFGTLAAESVLDPTDDRAFEDIGIYVKELGLSFALTESASIAEPPRFYRRLLSSYFKLQCRLFSSLDSMRPLLLVV